MPYKVSDDVAREGTTELNLRDCVELLCAAHMECKTSILV